MHFPSRLLIGALLLTAVVYGWLAWNTVTSYRSAEQTRAREVRLEHLRGVIVHLDEVLTMSARMAAVTGDLKWEKRYRRFEPQLDAAIKETIGPARDPSLRVLVRQTDAANRRLVDMENRSFTAVRAGRREQAFAVLFSPAYETQKHVYVDGMTRLMTIVTRQSGATVEVQARRSLYSLAATLAMLSVTLAVWIALTRSIRGVHAELERRVEERTTELGVRNAELEALYDVSEAVSRAVGMNELFDKALESIETVPLMREWRQGGIFLVDGGRLRLAAHRERTLSKGFIKAHENLREGECLCGLAAQTGEIVVSANSGKDDRHTLRCPGVAMHGHVIVPLRAMARIVGVMYLYTPADVQIEERALRLLQAIGDRMGLAIETVKLYEHTRELSLRDPLTGLANRRLMHIELDKNFARAKRLHRPFSVIMLDLDHFKDFNDAHGHDAGDRLLADLAGIIRRETREMDLAVRYGGEEFLVVLPETGLKHAKIAAERIRTSVMKTEFGSSAGGTPAHATVSAGVATYREDIAGHDELVRMADQAMYAAKEHGRNRMEFWAA